MDDHLPFIGWSPTNPRMVNQQKEVNYRLGIKQLDLITKLRPGDNCHGWSPTIPRMVTHQPKDGYPTEGHNLHTRNLALRLNLQN